jgi:hypothetical protein
MSNAIRELFRVKGQIEINMRAARAELDAINKAIEVLRRAENPPSRVTSRHRAAQSGEFAGLSLPDSCRRVVGKDPMLPSEVCDILIQRGYPVPKLGPRRLYSHVFVTLKRLSEPDKDLVRGTKDGKFAVHKPPKDISLVPVNGLRTSFPLAA